MIDFKVFVGGYMHSGTTLLYNVLKRHPYLFGFEGETRLLEYYKGHDKRLRQCKGEADVNAFVKQFASTLMLDGEDFKYIVSKSSELDTTGINRLFEDISQQLASRHGKNGWVEKTPTNVYFAAEILEKFPSSKLILIYRDFRDVLASKKTRTLTVESGRYEKEQIQFKTLEKDWNVLADAISWNKSIDAQINALSNYGGEVYVVSYEGFVTEPKRELQQICEFLGIPFDQNCLEIEFSNKADMNSRAKGIYATSIASWRNVLSRREILLGNFLTKNRLKLMRFVVSKEEQGSFPVLWWYLLREIPGVIGRVYKRIRLLGWNKAFWFFKNYLQRFQCK